ncbi:MAG: hypothetical protein J1E98_12405 [Lachnospiraceae bacterium]|nr:hypothetical protein [Lachnospiraceae bacterium]
MKKESGKRITLSAMLDKCINFLDSIITPGRLLCLLIVVFIAGLIPLFWIGVYNYPVADDYTFGAACRGVWMESHSAIAVIVRAATRAWEYYQNWTGCLSSSFFMALQPAVFGEGLYKITPVLMVGIISLGTVYLMNIIFVKLLKANAYLSNSIIVLMLLVTIQRMPEPGEGLFWYNGALHYTFMHGISLFFYGLLLSAFMQKSERKKCRDFIISAILGFIVGLGNYMTALNVGIVLAMLIFAIVLLKRFKQQRLILIPAVVFYLAFIMNITAPGNALREAVSEGMSPFKAIFVSFYYVLDYCIGEWTGWAELVFVILIATFFWNASKGIDFKFPCPLFVILLNYCILAAMITPPLYGTGNIEAGRIQSLVYIMYILLLTLTVCYVTGWAQKRFDENRTVALDEAAKVNSTAEKLLAKDFLSVNSKITVTACIVFLLFGSLLCVIPQPEYYTCSIAAVDLLNGNAAAYGEAMQERVEIYNTSAGLDVEVAPLPAKPKLICTSDISIDNEDWVNAGVCRFYGLNSVCIEAGE